MWHIVYYVTYCTTYGTCEVVLVIKYTSTTCFVVLCLPIFMGVSYFFTTVFWGFFYLTVRLQARDFYKVEDDNLTRQGLFTSAGYRGTKVPGYEVGKMILLKTVIESHG